MNVQQKQINAAIHVYSDSWEAEFMADGWLGTIQLWPMIRPVFLFLSRPPQTEALRRRQRETTALPAGQMRSLL